MSGPATPNDPAERDRSAASDDGPARLGSVLRALRIEADLTLEALAERSGLSDRTISDIERGVSTGPQRRTIDALATALALSEEESRELAGAARRGRHRRPTSPDATPDVPTSGGRDRATAVDRPSSERDASIVPRRLPDFTGRDAELADLSAFLSVADRPSIATQPAASRVAVISGPPGVGKTSLAVEALHRRSDVGERVFVDLGGLDPEPVSPLAVVQSILRQVSVGDEPPTTLPAAVSRWRDIAATKPIAVLLDNAAGETHVRPVLSATAATVVITSRRTLSGLEAVRRVTLGPLPLGDAISLLREIIPPRQAETGDLGVLARLCGTVPLALRIAGNRLASRPSWTVGDLVARLSDSERRLRTLVAGDLAVESTVAMSYDLLPAALAELFRGLSLLEGPTFDAQLVAMLTVDSDAASGSRPASEERSGTESAVAAAEDALDDLSDLGLIQALSGGRYRLHDLVRDVAAVRLHRETTEEDIERRRSRMCVWLLRTTIAAGLHFEPASERDRARVALAPSEHREFAGAPEARAWLESEVDHWMPALRRAAASGLHEYVVGTAQALHWFSDLWANDGRWYDVFSLSAASAEALGDPALEAEHRGYLAWAILAQRTDADGARQAFEVAESAHAAAVRAGDVLQRAWAEHYMAWAAFERGELRVSEAAAARSAADFEAAGHLEGMLQSFATRALVQREEGRFEEAIATFREQLAVVAGARDRLTPGIAMFTEANGILAIAGLLARLGRFEETIVAADDGFERASGIEYQRGRAAGRKWRGEARLAVGRRADGLADLREAVDLYERAALPRLAATVREQLARAEAGEEDGEDESGRGRSPSSP